MTVALRPATAADAPACRAVTMEAMMSYRAFAGERWQPPEETARELAERLATGWGVLAEDQGRAVGFGAFSPAREQPRSGPLVPGLAHVWAVFVAPDWWGAGLAAAIVATLVEQMRFRGFAEARLYTPVLQARARRFYAREGWHEHGAPMWVPALALDLVELRRLL